MALREDLTAATPRLRRFARALATGGSAPSEWADDLVQATLVRALRSRPGNSSRDLIVRLYATLTQLHRDVCEASPSAPTSERPVLVSSGVREDVSTGSVVSALMSLPLEEREAILLVVVEGFDHDVAARILRVARSVLVARLDRARQMLNTRLAPRRSRPAICRGVPHLRLVAG